MPRKLVTDIFPDRSDTYSPQSESQPVNISKPPPDFQRQGF